MRAQTIPDIITYENISLHLFRFPHFNNTNSDNSQYIAYWNVNAWFIKCEK